MAIKEPIPSPINQPARQHAIVSYHGRYGIIGEYQTVSDMPERRKQTGDPGCSYGSSASEPLAVTGEENIMCYEATNGNPGESIVVHEMAHTIMNGYALVDPILHAKVVAAYAAAMAAGKYKGLYAGTNADEYWAEGVQAYLNAHATWNPKDINDRTALVEYDPTLYSIIDGVFADVHLPPLCPAPVFSSTTWYRLSNEAFGGKSLDVDRMKPSGNFSGQYWHLHPLDSGRFRLTNMYNGETMALDTANDGVYEVKMAPVGRSQVSVGRSTFTITACTD